MVNKKKWKKVGYGTYQKKYARHLHLLIVPSEFWKDIGWEG